MYNGPEHYLDSDAAAGRFMTHARLLLKLSRRFEAIAPAGFRHAARVANFKSGKIVIHADNGAVASKLRQMSQRLCGELSKGGTQCIDMEVKVQPRESLERSITSTQKPLSENACRMLEEASGKLPPGPLRQALDSLLAHAARRG
ncbi:MAG: DciA family protein [Bacteroidota bacterium]